ncbi:SLC13 family permease [Peptococcus simiae]|uniref:SLC13 family permease n=1 Tax=Peptococcus simiae TaxID=1643805 RepID=A0ABW9GZM9_9FIRM
MVKAGERSYHKLIIYLAIIALFFLIIPPVGTISAEGMRLVGLFIAFVYGVTVTTDVWPSLLTWVFFPLTGVVTFKESLALNFGSDVFFFVLLSLVLLAYMETSGAAAFAAAWLLKRKFIVGHPWRLIFMLMFVCWLISSFVNAIAGMMLTWVFMYEIFAKFNYKPYEKFPSLMMLGTCAFGGLGLSTLPWGNNSIVILDVLEKTADLKVNYMEYILYTVPYALFVLAGFMLLCRFVFKLDVTPLKDFNPADLSQEVQKATPEKIVALLAMLSLILLILIPSSLPQDSPVAVFMGNFGLSGKLIFIFTVLQLIRINGKPACSFVENAKKGVSWKLVMMVAIILTFSPLIAGDNTGINETLGTVISPLFDNQPALVFIILAAIVTVICTNFMINKIIAILMVSITLPIGVQLGIDPLQLGFLYTVICTVAFMLPSASQSATVLFSNTEWVRAKDVYKYGLPMIILMTVLQVAWNLIFFAI